METQSRGESPLPCGTSTKLLTKNELEAGDILLSRGSDFLASLISTLDGSRFSHSSIFTGEGVAEAVSNGLAHGSLEDSLNAHPRQFVEVFRRQNEGSAEILPMGPVVAASLEIVSAETKYAWCDLALVSLLALASWPALNKTQREARKLQLAKTLPLLRQAVVARESRSMTCSQLVAMAYANADPVNGSYALQLNISGHLRLRSALGLKGDGGNLEDDEMIAEFMQRSRELLNSQVKSTTGAGAFDPMRDTSIYAFEGGWPPHLVSPRDIYSSKNIKHIGELKIWELDVRPETKEVMKRSNGVRRP